MNKTRQRGYSMIEFLLVVALLMPLLAAVFQFMSMATARSSAEQTRLDMFQEAREFMDQMSRDLRQVSYPNVRDYVRSALTVSPVSNDPKVAVGLVKISPAE